MKSLDSPKQFITLLGQMTAARAKSADVSPKAGPTKGLIFVKRLVSSVILWTIVLLAIFSKNKIVSDYFFLLIIVFFGGAGLVEFYNLARKRGLVCFMQVS